MSAILGLLNVIPAWAWALMLAGSLATGCVEQHKLSTARLELQTLKTAVADQKAKAAKELADLTAQAAAKDKRAHESWMAGELQNAQNTQTIADLQSRIDADRSRTGGRMRDPFGGCGPSGGGAQAGSTPGAQAGEGNPAEAGGLLSPEFTRFLDAKDADADAINIAYIACRADNDTLRTLLK